ncbi:MAG: hypothetical protein AAB692_03205 [Patescibacteria group bacterium]
MTRTPVFLAPIVVGGAYLAAAKLAPLADGHFWIIVAAAAAVMLVALAVLLAFICRGLGRAAGARFMIAPLLFAVGAYGFLLLVETSGGRYGLTLGVMAGLGMYAEELRLAARLRRLSDVQAVEHFGHPLRLLGLFFLLAFLFGVNAFAHVPVAVRAIIAGLAAMLAAAPVFDAVLESKKAWTVSAAFALMMAELFAAFALLPIAGLASAGALTLLFSGCLHLTRQPFTAAETPRQARRSFASSIALTAVVLATAQWI